MMGWMAPLRHLSARMLTGRRPAANGEPSMSEITTIGLDLAKHVLQQAGHMTASDLCATRQKISWMVALPAALGRWARPAFRAPEYGATK